MRCRQIHRRLLAKRLFAREGFVEGLAKAPHLGFRCAEQARGFLLLRMHLGLHGRYRLARGGEGFIERDAGLLELLDLHLVAFAPSDVPELLGGLKDGQGKLLRFAAGRSACIARVVRIGQAGAAAAAQALAERGEPALEHGADRVGRSAADLLAYALDGGTQPVLQERVGGFPDLGLLNAVW
ncbi:hypothetical protein QTI68_34560 [Variovorax sp. J31P207]|nr:hypothetical protein [Variovorax sp. J31P207]MDM0071693.1 hypothetical protein [Variovorax sp. J31P207]